MEITHRTRNLRIAPRKLRLVADQIRYRNPEEALGILNVTPQKGAHLIAKSLKSAIQVAKDNNLETAELVIQRIWCDEGTSLKRAVSRSRGRLNRIMKKYSHLSVVLKGEERSRKTTRPRAAKAEVPADQPTATPEQEEK